MSATRRQFLQASGLALATTASLSAADESPAPAAKFKLGLVTYNVAQNWDLPTVLRICKTVGISAVECRTTHKHLVEPTLSGDARKAVKAQFADAGVVFWGSGSTCEFHSAESSVVKKNVETCKDFIQLVADLGGKGVKVRPNGVAKGKTLEQACQQIGDALKLCGKAAADAGVEIWVEVHGSVTQLPTNMNTIMSVCDHPSVGLTWNSNPTDLVSGSIDSSFELLKSRIKSCHINDLTNDKAGKYPYRQLFKLLRTIGYDRYTLCEVGKGYDPVAGEAFLKDYKRLWDELVAA